MMCRAPYMVGSIEVRCGRCMPCRINTRRTWTARIVVESLSTLPSVFVTTTFSEEFYPKDGSVRVRDVQLFVKRLRSRFPQFPIRFFAVGEYGSRTWRPHYHFLFFGAALQPRDVAEVWQQGFVSVGSVSLQSAQYCAAYTTKKLTKPGSPELNGRTPEFMRCSLRPGIGAPAVDLLAQVHYTQAGARFLSERKDVCQYVRIGGSLYPIGRYLTRLLRARMGLPEQDPRRMIALLEEVSQYNLPDIREMRQAKRAAHNLTAIGRVSKSTLSHPL